MARYMIAAEEDLSNGDSLGTEAGGIEIAVFNVDGDLYAIQNVCIHKQGPMYQGDLDEDNCSVYCPWHSWEFDLETGQFAVDETKQLRTFDVEVENGEIWVEI